MFCHPQCLSVALPHTPELLQRAPELLPGFEWPWIRVFTCPSFRPYNFVLSPALNGAPDLSQVPSPNGGCSVMGREWGPRLKPYSHRLRGVINRISSSSLDSFQVRWQGHPPSPKAPVMMFPRNSHLQGLCVPINKISPSPLSCLGLMELHFYRQGGSERDCPFFVATEQVGSTASSEPGSVAQSQCSGLGIELAPQPGCFVGMRGGQG